MYEMLELIVSFWIDWFSKIAKSWWIANLLSFQHLELLNVFKRFTSPDGEFSSWNRQYQKITQTSHPLSHQRENVPNRWGYCIEKDRHKSSVPSLHLSKGSVDVQCVQWTRTRVSFPESLCVRAWKCTWVYGERPEVNGEVTPVPETTQSQ